MPSHSVLHVCIKTLTFSEKWILSFTDLFCQKPWLDQTWSIQIYIQISTNSFVPTFVLFPPFDFVLALPPPVPPPLFSCLWFFYLLDATGKADVKDTFIQLLVVRYSHPLVNGNLTFSLSHPLDHFFPCVCGTVYIPGALCLTAQRCRFCFTLDPLWCHPENFKSAKTQIQVSRNHLGYKSENLDIWILG